MTMCTLCKIGWSFIGVGGGIALGTKHKFLGGFLIAVGIGIGGYAQLLKNGYFIQSVATPLIEESPYTPNQVTPSI